MVLLVLKETLLNLNYDAITTTVGQEALKTIDSGAGKFDLVLSDVVMPGWAEKILCGYWESTNLMFPLF